MRLLSLGKRHDYPCCLSKSSSVLQHETLYLGEKRIRIRTSVLEEKATACNMLCCYADELKEGFFPYVEEVGQQLPVSRLCQQSDHQGCWAISCAQAPVTASSLGEEECCTAQLHCQNSLAAQHKSPAQIMRDNPSSSQLLHDGALQGWHAFPCLHPRAESLPGLFFRVRQDWHPTPMCAAQGVPQAQAGLCPGRLASSHGFVLRLLDCHTVSCSTVWKGGAAH